jgi:N-acetylmuramoyl-L-alanine amidase
MLSNNQEGSGWVVRGQRVAIIGFVLAALGLIAAQTAPSPAGSQPASPQTPAAPTQAAQSPVQSIPTPPKPLIIIDPAHGGTESGAVLNPTILEKDITLALARRLRLDVGTHGLVAELVRDGDVNLSTDDRAARANAAHPVLYVCLHATSEIGGIRIYTAMLGEGEDRLGPFIGWNTAQFPSLRASRAAQQGVASAIQKSGIAARSLVAPLRPLNNVISPAIAVELAPAKSDISQLESADYQQTISTAIANGIAQVVSTLETSSGASR